MNLRKRKSLTQRQVAEVLGVTDQAISNWERGRVDFRMTATQWVKLLQLLDCTPEELASDAAAKAVGEA